MSKRKKIIAQNEISEMFTFKLGGYAQKVLIEGRKRDLPVLISLHGGPGSPIPFSAGCRGLFPAFTDRFILVSWDQLGCGINNRQIGEEFSVQSFVDMTADLIRAVKELFPENRLYLFAVSWGSILSAKVLGDVRGLVDGVVVSGQITKKVFFNDEVYSALEQSRLPKDKLEKIKAVDINRIMPEDLQTVSASLMKYTQGYTNNNGKPSPIAGVVWGMITSPDYSLRDFKAVVLNGYRENRSLWQEIVKLDLTDVLKAVDVPYFIVQGETDIVASTREIMNLVQTAGNPKLRCRIMPNSGHMFGAEGMEEIFRTLCEITQ